MTTRPTSPHQSLHCPSREHQHRLTLLHPSGFGPRCWPQQVASYELQVGPEAQRLFGPAGNPDQEEAAATHSDGQPGPNAWTLHDLTIKVQDGGNPTCQQCPASVTVLDTNDNAPKLERPSYEAELSENSPIGHSVIQVRPLCLSGVTHSTLGPLPSIFPALPCG